VRVFACRLFKAFEIFEWLCADHIKQRRADGYDVLARFEVKWPCDRCQKGAD